MAASPKISSSTPAPGSASARCASPLSRRWRLWRRTSWCQAMAAMTCTFWYFQTSPLAALPESTDVSEVIGNESVRDGVALGLAKLRAQSSGGSSGHATRALLLAEPASVDGGEITDKGYINQRAVLTRRAGAVAMLDDDSSAEWIGCAG